VIRVLLADDNAFVRSGLTELLTAAGDVEVVAACGDGDEVVAAAERTRPDVVVLDVVMARVGGLEAARDLLEVQPDARIVFLTANASAAALREARDLGAAGFLLKDVDPDGLVRSVRQLAAGHSLWDVDDPDPAPSAMTKAYLANTNGHDATGASDNNRGLWS
jgi:DNA-binding NarL/FixJ family response regulator